MKGKSNYSSILTIIVDEPPDWSWSPEKPGKLSLLRATGIFISLYSLLSQAASQATENSSVWVLAQVHICVNKVHLI